MEFLSERVCIHSYVPHKGNELTDLIYMNEHIKYIRSDQIKSEQRSYRMTYTHS